MPRSGAVSDSSGLLSEIAVLSGILGGLMADGPEGAPDGEASSAVVYLDATEILAAFQALSGGEKLKLGVVDARLRGETAYEPTELLRESLTRALLGRRRCPRDVPFMAFMVETMRSIAFHDRQRRAKNETFEDCSETSPAPSAMSGARPPTPEETMMSDETVRTIHAHFDGDEKAGMLLLGWGADLKGKDLCEFVGEDQPGLDYLIKRVRRSMNRLYPNGFRP
jgi:hypothetical protein